MQNKSYHNPLEGERPDFSIPLNDDGTNEIISIIIVHRNKPEFLNILLHSIAITSINSNYEIIVVDNNSNEESQAFLDQIEEDVKVIRNEKNIYWGPAANQGANAADKSSKYLIFMHCDVVILNNGWMDLLTSISEQKKTGMLGLELGHYYIQGQQTDFIQEWCVLMTRDCWNDCGPFPELLPQVGPSLIPTMKAQQKGYSPQVIKNPICHHYKIFSLGDNISEYEKLIEKAYINIPVLIRQLQIN